MDKEDKKEVLQAAKATFTIIGLAIAGIALGALIAKYL